MALTDRLATNVLLAIGAISCRLSVSTRQRLGALLGRQMMWLSAKRRTITFENIQCALPQMTNDEHVGVMRGSYENLGMVLAELLATPSLTSKILTERVSILGFENVLERHRLGKPTIFLSAHYGNWEYLAMTAGVLLDAPVTIVVHPQSNRSADKLLNNYRTRFGNIVVPMGEAARPLVRALSSGGVVAFLVDQFGQPEKDPWVDFFGRPTATYEAPAALALKYNASIYYAFAERMEDGRYHAPIRELPMSDLSNNREGIIELTRRHVAVLEEAIMRRPDLWSWQHRRWRGEYIKTR